MGEVLIAVLGWLVPAVVVFGAAAAAVAVLAWVVRRTRRSPRARAQAAAARDAAGAALVQLDDAVGELDLEVGLSGALYGGDAPASLRRARMTAQHVRDRSFEEFRELGDDGGLLPAEIARRAERVRAHAQDALGVIARAGAEHAEWMRANVSAAAQVTAARARLAALRGAMGDPTALVDDLSSRFDEAEGKDAAAAAADAGAAADRAEALLERAAEATADPSRSALGDLAAAERELRSAHAASRALEETHRRATQAAQALPGELDAAHAAIRQALGVRASLQPADAERLGAAVSEIEASLAAAEADARRRPTATVDRIARLRDRLDLALGDARTAQERLRGARTALPGTLAAARNAVARAEASVADAHAGADARVRLSAAHDELARARQASDPVAALDAARRAMRHGEDAIALADYDRLTGRL